jgi:hypothetical protein
LSAVYGEFFCHSFFNIAVKVRGELGNEFLSKTPPSFATKGKRTRTPPGNMGKGIGKSRERN